VDYHSNLLPILASLLLKTCQLIQFISIKLLIPAKVHNVESRNEDKYRYRLKTIKVLDVVMSPVCIYLFGWGVIHGGRKYDILVQNYFIVSHPSTIYTTQYITDVTIWVNRLDQWQHNVLLSRKCYKSQFFSQITYFWETIFCSCLLYSTAYVGHDLG
jgi:hypothetical protein